MEGMRHERGYGERREMMGEYGEHMIGREHHGRDHLEHDLAGLLGREHHGRDYLEHDLAEHYAGGAKYGDHRAIDMLHEKRQGGAPRALRD